MFELQKLEEQRMISIHHQEVQKLQQNAWHNINIRRNYILVGDLVLLYNNIKKYTNLQSLGLAGWDLMSLKELKTTYKLG